MTLTIKGFLKQEKMSVAQLADKAGIAKQTLWMHLKKESDLTERTREKLITLGINEFESIKDLIAESIRYIVENDEGNVYCYSEKQADGVCRWLKGRGYKYEKKEHRNSWEVIHNKKIK